MCAVDHAAVKLDSRWLSLRFIGIQQDWDDSGEYAPLELRNCECGTTLAKPVTLEVK